MTAPNVSIYGLAIDPSAAEEGARRTTDALDDILEKLDELSQRVTKAADELDILSEPVQGLQDLDVALRTIRADFASGDVSAEQYAAALAEIRTEAIALRREAGTLSTEGLTAYQRILSGTAPQTTQAARAAGQLNRAFAQVAATAAGVPGPLGRVAGSLSRLAGPVGWVTLAAGSVVGLAAAYRFLTRESREAAQESDARIARWRKERDAIDDLTLIYQDLVKAAQEAEQRRDRPLPGSEAGLAIVGGLGPGGPGGADVFASAIEQTRATEAAEKRAEVMRVVDDLTKRVSEGTADLRRETELFNATDEEAIDIAARQLEIRRRQEVGLGHLRDEARAEAEARIKAEVAAFREREAARSARDEGDRARRQREQETQERERLIERILASAAALDLEALAMREGWSEGRVLTEQLIAQATAAGLTGTKLDEVAAAAKRMGEVTDDIIAQREADQLVKQRQESLARLIASLEAEYRATQLSAEALVRYEAAQLGATDADLARIVHLQRALAQQRQYQESLALYAQVQASLTEIAAEESAAYEVVWARALENTQDAFARFFQQVTTAGVESFRDLASQVIAVWQSMVANLLASQVFGAIADELFGPKLPAFPEIGALEIPEAPQFPVPAFAAGGLVGNAAPTTRTPLDPDAMVAIVHRGEQVIRPQDQPMGAGINITIPVQALDGRDVVRALRAHTPELLAILAPYFPPDVRAFGNRSRRG